MSYNFVTVQGKYQSSTGVPATGRVEWWPTTPIVDTINHITLTEVVPTLYLDVTGMFSVLLLANDNAGLNAFGWAFRPDIMGVSTELQIMNVPFLTGPSTKWLDQLTNFTP